MNTTNFINMIKMSNIMVDFKIFLQPLSPKNQLYEINSMINQLINLIANVKILKKNHILNELTTLKKEIVINHKKHLQNHFNCFYYG